MKIIQSYWSKPGQIKDTANFNNHNRCGWLEKHYHYYSWILSVNQLRKYYDDVELVTDNAGYELLINKLELPYTKVQVVLDDLNDYDKNLWALGKIYAYSIQDEPFIHVDGDVYIWERFGDDIENANLVCQNKEEGASYNNIYKEIFIPIVQNFDYYPEVLDWSIGIHDSIKAINAGILGGNNINFYKEYSKAAFEFVNRNLKSLSTIKVSSFNIIFEQFLFRAMAESKGESVSYFYKNSDNPAYSFNFTGILSQTKYLHMCGLLKTDRPLVNWLADVVLDQYPDNYYNIKKLLRTNSI